jgi:two-component system, NarL family, sensor histidine kinase DegS
MSTDPYTRGQMDASHADAAMPAASPQDPRPASFAELHAEAKAALTYSANALRVIRERFREGHATEVARWQTLYDELDGAERRPVDAPPLVGGEADAAAAAEVGANDARVRALRSEVERLGEEVGDHQSQLARLDLAIKNLESTWVFLEHGDATLVTEPDMPGTVADMQMRIVEAQEAERTRLAQEIHDGPGQALTNAIFQVEYVDRILVRDPRAARAELRFLRDVLRRELSDVRTFISALRPPVLDQLGLDGAINETIDHMKALTGLPILTSLTAPPERLGEAAQTVVLRIVQEALHNVRKHAAASTVTVSTEARDGEWTLEVRDDGHGFDVGAVAARGRRNFGLQFMRERAELIGASFDVRSRPDGGTVVRLMIPVGARGE